MISLVELLHSVNAETKEGLVNIDDWRLPDIDHLINMGFELGDDWHLNTPKDPKITVYKKKDMNQEAGKKEEYFYVEEPKRETKRFKEFGDLIDYFDKYDQPEIDKYK